MSGAYPVLHRRVAVVDDDDLVARITARILSREGHHVRIFEDATDALRAMREDPDAFEVLVTDQNMPGMTGTALIQAARALRPTLRAVLSTGCDAPPTEAAALSVEFVRKPFPADVLLRAVRGAP
ncbi:MAG: response regulator [Polyangiales bacterium]